MEGSCGAESLAAVTCTAELKHQMTVVLMGHNDFKIITTVKHIILNTNHMLRYTSLGKIACALPLPA